MAWKAWYYDLSTFSSADGPWQDAPENGVVCVCTTSSDIATYNRDVIWGFDFYVKRPIWDEPRGLDKLGHLISTMGEMPPVPFPLEPRGFLDGLGTPYSQMVKYGIQLPDAEFWAVMDAAAADGMFPVNKKPRRRFTDWEAGGVDCGEEWYSRREWRDA